MEIQLEKISTIEDANRCLARFLSKHNKKLVVKPTKKIDLHKEILKSTIFDRTLCRNTQRKLRNDFTMVLRRVNSISYR